METILVLIAAILGGIGGALIHDHFERKKLGLRPWFWSKERPSWRSTMKPNRSDR